VPLELAASICEERLARRGDRVRCDPRGAAELKLIHDPTFSAPDGQPRKRYFAAKLTELSEKCIRPDISKTRTTRAQTVLYNEEK
jgi:hypothetical protein